VAFPSSPNPLKEVVAQMDDSIWREALITKVCNEPNATNPMSAWTYALGNLKYGVNEMYGGSLILLGDSTIKPLDVIFMNDYYTDMHGAFEVREVNHHFSHETGFITTVVPDCICYTNNAMAMASEAIAGGWYDDVANSLMGVYNAKIPFIGRITPRQILSVAAVIAGSYAITALADGGVVSGWMNAAGKWGYPNGTVFTEEALGAKIGQRWGRPSFIRSAIVKLARGITKLAGKATPLLIEKAGYTVVSRAGLAGAAVFAAEKIFGKKSRNAAQALMFTMGGWTYERREPINFLPLYYAGRPFLAGVKGMRKSGFFEPYAEGWRRLKYYYTNLAPRYISQQYDQAVKQGLSAKIDLFPWQSRIAGSSGV